MKFSAKGSDNDLYYRDCAQLEWGGWWYKKCSRSNPNGFYVQGGDTTGHQRQDSGIIWFSWKGELYSMKSIVMMIKPQ